MMLISAFIRQVARFGGPAGTSTASAFITTLVTAFTAASTITRFSHFLTSSLVVIHRLTVIP